jgi:hypothetical protein
VAGHPAAPATEAIICRSAVERVAAECAHGRPVRVRGYVTQGTIDERHLVVADSARFLQQAFIDPGTRVLVAAEL